LFKDAYLVKFNEDPVSSFLRGVAKRQTNKQTDRQTITPWHLQSIRRIQSTFTCWQSLCLLFLSGFANIKP